MRAAVAALALAVAASAGRAEILRVGTAAACDEDTLALALLRAALNGDAADVVRLPRDTTYTGVALHLTDWDPAAAGSLAIEGGYDSCADTTRSGVTILHGNGADPVVEVDTSSRPVSVVSLRNLELRSGSPGLLAEAGAAVYVEFSSIRVNEGGVAITAGADVEVNHASEVRENSGAAHGGGISCVGSGARLTLFGRVAYNSATGGGGGIYAAGGCLVRLRSNVWIEGNQADLGGGLFLAGSARAENLGTGIANLNIYENVAFSEGGGIYMAGTGPQTLLGNVRIVSNQAGERGGGVALVGGARLQVERFNFEQCLTAPRCVKINENSVDVGGFGSAVWADGGSEFRMAQGYAEANTGPDFATQSLFHAAGGGTAMLLEGVQIAHNATQNLLVAETGAEIKAAFVSAARNTYEFLGAPVGARGGDATGGAAIRLFTSILVDQSAFYSFGGEIHGDCLLLDTADGLTSHAASMVGWDPRFVDADSGDLHLRPDSPAIDACDTLLYTPLDSDFDLDARGYDFTLRPDYVGPFDRGADEFRPIFADGFESGGPGAWSQTVG